MTEADILAMTYYHTAIVERPMPVKRGRFDDYELSVVYDKLQCAVSFTKGSDIGESDTVQAIDYVAELFAGPRSRLRQVMRLRPTCTGRYIALKQGKACGI